MRIPILGQLLPHPSVPDGWLISPLIPIPYFEGLELRFTLDGLEDGDESEVNAAIEAFMTLGPKDRLEASRHVYENYRVISELASNDDFNFHIQSDQEVWDHVHPTDIFVSRRQRRDKAIYISVTADCDWEAEHGLQIIYRRGSELSRVSALDGHLTYADAYDLPEDQDDEYDSRSRGKRG